MAPEAAAPRARALIRIRISAECIAVGVLGAVLGMLIAGQVTTGARHRRGPRAAARSRGGGQPGPAGRPAVAAPAYQPGDRARRDRPGTDRVPPLAGHPRRGQRAYRLQLGRLVSNVSELYSVTSRLPVFTAGDEAIRVLHVSDLHLNPAAYEVIGSVVRQFDIDVVVDTGDVTDFGSEPETRYVQGIGRLGVQYVYLRGNHDSRLTQAAVARQPNAVILDGPQVVEVAGLRLLDQGDPRFTPDKITRDDDAPTRGPRAGRPAGAGSGGGTTVFVQGSTGGAGLRALEGEDPTDISLSVLYLDPETRLLQAYDDITLGGLGLTDARISRRVVAAPAGPEPSPSRPTPTPSG